MLGACCEVGEGESLATLTDADVALIERATGLLRKRFCEEEWLTAEEAHAYEERRPLYLGYFRSAPRRLTLRWRSRTGRSACVLLGTHGCTLPEDSRPTACRLYPFELWPDGSWSLQVERHGGVSAAQRSGRDACLAVEEASSMEEVLAALGKTRTEVESLGERLRREVQAHPRAQVVRKRRTRH